MKSGKLIRLLIIVLIICVMNSTTFVHISQAAFPPGFDQSRIRLETKIGHKVVLQFDQIELYGTLIRQVPISEQELEELIRQTMEDMGIDSLERLNEIVNKADQWEEITDDEIMQLLRDLVTTITTVEAFGPYPQDLVTIIGFTEKR